MGDHVLLLEWSLENHILPGSVEIGNGVASWALADILSTYAVVVRLEAVV